MTRIGYAVTIALMGVSLVALIVCSVRQRKGPSQALRASSPQRGEPRMAVKCVEGEPVVFRRLDEHYVSCRASGELSRDRIEAMGFDPADPLQRARALQETKKELAYILADQMLEAGAIRYEMSGGVLRAKVRAAVEGSGLDG